LVTFKVAIMQEIVASVDGISFDIEIALQQQLGAQSLPFPGMDKSGAAICTFHLNNSCMKGITCPFRHVRGDRTVVCKHWLRGLCKKGDDCEFLHEFDMSKMPECYFFSKFGQCSNKDCPFLHIDPEAKVRDCAWYDRGFCRHGPQCKNRHVRRILCLNYLCGFCPEGKDCKFMHPCFDLPAATDTQNKFSSALTCHFCNELGHKQQHCPKNPLVQQQQNPGSELAAVKIMPHKDYERRPLQDVTCFKCSEKGHYANKCPKGHLAFLHNRDPRDVPPQDAGQ